MQEEKSFVYTMILGVCMLLSLLLIGKMLLQRPAEPPSTPPQTETQEGETPVELELDENDLCTLIVQALPLTPDSISARIGKDGLIEVSATVSKQVVQQSGLAGDMRTALLFLPDVCKVYGAWQVEARDGAIHLTTKTAELADIALSDNMAAPLTELLNQNVNAQLTDWGVTVSSLECSDGKLLLKP